MVGSTPPLHARLTHLSEEQLEDLIARYYSRATSVRALMDEFNIPGKPSSFVSILPPIVHDELTCPHCPEQNLISGRPSRDSAQEQTPYCYKCGHKSSPKCACKTCLARAMQVAKEIDAHKRAVIRTRLSNYSSPDLDIESLTFRGAVFLLAVFRHSVTEDLEAVAPHAARRDRLAPTADLRDQIVKDLRQDAYICVDPESSPEAFIFTEDLSDCPRCYLDKVDWLFLPGIDTELKKDFIAQLERTARDGPWPEHWRYGAFDLWLEIAKAECFEYYALQLSQRGYEAEFGEKTHAVFDNLLETFSIGQVFNLTWQAVRDMTDYIVKNRLPKYHAKNTFIGAIQKRADKHRAEKWIPRVSRRDFECPQSVVSAVFFELFMGIGTRALETLPRLDWAKVDTEADAEIPF